MNSKPVDNSLTQFLEENDISVTKFLDSSTASNSTGQQQNVSIDQDDHTLMIEFLEADNGDISVTKFLDGGRPTEYENEDMNESEYEDDSNDSEEWEEYGDENTIMSND